METIEDLKKQLSELQQKIYKSEQDNYDGYPPTGEYCYWMTPASITEEDVVGLKLHCAIFDRGNIYHRQAYKSGIYHATKEQAIYCAERAAALVILRNEAKRCWEKYSNDRSIKYYLCYADNKWGAASFLFEASAIATNMPYFPTKEDAVLAMELLGDKEKYFR